MSTFENVTTTPPQNSRFKKQFKPYHDDEMTMMLHASN